MSTHVLFLLFLLFLSTLTVKVNGNMTIKISAEEVDATMGIATRRSVGTMFRE